MDDRCEAIFAKWAELRPTCENWDWCRLAFVEGHWQWRSPQNDCYGVDDAPVHLLAALLPAAINKLRANKSAVLVDEIPATLEDAVRLLEGV